LCEKFEVLLEDTELVPESIAEEADVTLANGVLNVLIPGHGTYVINKQSPNRQIWLSSPLSGPYRYDFDSDKQTWIYRHSGQSLHDLLEQEVGKQILQLDQEVGFKQCHLGGEGQES